MIELAKLNCPDADFRTHDCRLLRELNQTYDSVMCGFFLPYLSKSEVSDFFRTVASILPSGGIFYISFMEDCYSRSGFETTSFSNGHKIHIYYHEAHAIIDSLNEQGFEVLETFRKKYDEDDGSVTIDLIFIARKQ